VYSLSKNYPNPFNPTTTIDYTIPEAGKVNLVIYNTAGQKVRTLVNQTQDAAYYKVVWDGRDDSGMSVASGIYFYRLSADKFSKIEKMTLLK
jgi:flagellar hook assembly protein FlgD